MKRTQGNYLLRRYAAFVTAMMVSLGSVAHAGVPRISPLLQDAQSSPGMATYVGRTVKSVELPGVSDAERLLQMVPQKAGQPLDRDDVRESIRILYSTGLFADIQAEVTPVDGAVVLRFTTLPNLFVGAVDVEGAPRHPTYNQIVNA